MKIHQVGAKLIHEVDGLKLICAFHMLQTWMSCIGSFRGVSMKAQCHTARLTVDILVECEVIPAANISCFVLWVFHKECMYQNNTRSMQLLKLNTISTINSISWHMSLATRSRGLSYVSGIYNTNLGMVLNGSLLPLVILAAVIESWL